jgi:hypothetical protein
MKSFSPRPYQTIGAEWIAEHPRCALWAGMGMGKTVTTLNVLDAIHNLAGESEPTLILAPLRVARDTWPDEAGKWQHLAGFDIVPITGTAAERKAALRRDAQVYTVNYENLPWLVDQLDGQWPFANVIADEATKLKSFRLKQGGVRAQALARFAHTPKVRRWVNLTGTPASNGLKDLWGQTWFLDAGVRLGRTYGSFEERFFRPVRNADGYFDWLPTSYTQDHIQAQLQDICLTLDPADWFDIEAPIVNRVSVTLPAKARAKYREMEREFFTQIDGADIEAVSAASKSQKCLMMASGTVYTDSEKKVWAEIHDEKLAALESVLNEAGGMPVLCAHWWVPDRERILKAFPKAVDLATREGMAAFKAGKSPLGVAHPQSLGHGIDGLQDITNIVCFYSAWWGLETHDQIIERVGPVRQMQSGHNRPVFIHYLTAEGTLDEVVLERYSSKRQVQDLLLDYMKGKR